MIGNIQWPSSDEIEIFDDCSSISINDREEYSTEWEDMNIIKIQIDDHSESSSYFGNDSILR